MRRYAGVIIFVLAGTAGAPAHAGRVHQTHDSDSWYDVSTRFERHVERVQERQWRRIERGWRQGDLSRREFRRLKREQRRIAGLERAFSTDGHFSKKERRALRRRMDRADDHIYQARHDDSRRHGTRWIDDGKISRRFSEAGRKGRMAEVERLTAPRSARRRGDR